MGLSWTFSNLATIITAFTLGTKFNGDTMNGKKAKLLRALVGGIDSAETKYQVQQDTIKLKQVKDLYGHVIMEYRTGTLELAPCARKFYRGLKKNYLRSVRTKSAIAI